MDIEAVFEQAQRLHRLGKANEAVVLYRNILSNEPDHFNARLYLAICEMVKGRIIEARELANAAFKSNDPGQASAYINYGIILKASGDLEAAERSYQKALGLDPDSFQALSNLANLKLLQGKKSEAEPMLVRLTQEFEDPAAFLNLARIRLSENAYDEADKLLQNASDINPKFPDLNHLRALVQFHIGDHKQAFKYLMKLLEIQPSHREGWTLLMGLSPLSINPDELQPILTSIIANEVSDLSVLITATMIARRWFLHNFVVILETKVAAACEDHTVSTLNASAVFSSLCMDLPGPALRKIARSVWGGVTTTRIKKLYHKNLNLTVHSSRKPRVGFLSSDMRNHAVGYLMVGFFEKLNTDKFEYYIYSNSPADASKSRGRIRNGAARIKNIYNLSDEELISSIREDEVSILIDLNGVTNETRVYIMAARCAPIQVSWLGMPGTIGADGDVDYIIADKWTIPIGSEDSFSERVIRLPNSYQPNDHRRPDLTVGGTRADHNLDSDSFIFCCFNQYQKISPYIVEMWAKILNENEHAFLWLLKPETDVQQNFILQVFLEAGICGERIVWADRVPQAEHIARLSHADLVLDTLPYNAHTTCSDALRAGVPVLALPGVNFASRVSEGIVRVAGLSDWVANSREEYVKIAVNFSKMKRSEIEAVKQGVSEKYWASPMSNMDDFVVHFENSLEAILAEKRQSEAQGVSL